MRAVDLFTAPSRTGYDGGGGVACGRAARGATRRRKPSDTVLQTASSHVRPATPDATRIPAGEVDYILGKQVKSSRYQNTEQHVRENIAFARPGSTNITLVPGFVEDTLPKFESGPIALLRLDTDFYNSTKVEFDILYDRLVPGGVLIVDDYGLFDGSRTATDEFLAGLDNAPLLNRIDKGVWSGVKPG